MALDSEQPVDGFLPLRPVEFHILAIWTTRALGSLLFGVGALDIATFLAVAATVVSIGMVASYVPALRASKVDPIESLRSD